MSQWTHKVHPQRLPSELQELRHAAQDLAQQAEHHAPGRTGIAFKSVSDVLILSSAAIGVTLGLMHLVNKLYPKHAAPPTPPPAALDVAGDSHHHRQRLAQGKEHHGQKHRG
jgi:hypothetical protein